MDLLQWPGAVLGLLGALLVAQNETGRRAAGFSCWIVSNTMLVGWAVHAHAHALVGLYVLYGAISIMGLSNSLKAAPDQSGPSPERDAR